MGRAIKEIPLVVLREITILPGVTAQFDVTAGSAVAAIEAAMARDGQIFLITQKNKGAEIPKQDDLYKAGIRADVTQLGKIANGTLRVQITNGERALLREILAYEPYMKARITVANARQTKIDEMTEEALSKTLKELIAVYILNNPKLNRENVKKLFESENSLFLMEQAMNCLPFSYECKQMYLEATTVDRQFEVLCGTLMNEAYVDRIKNQLHSQLMSKVELTQKEYILREQLKLIREELGEDEELFETDILEEKLEQLNAGSEVKEHIAKEIKRYKAHPIGSSESSVIRGYIETLLEMPWNTMSKDRLDIKNTEKILDRDHYGLEKVKERILEFLAVKALALRDNAGENLDGKYISPIICLVGPPGTGKTSIAKSVAEALNKKYVRVCLGGVRDEAEIRGHRRTYVGSMPGRIAAALRQAGVGNPLMLLDEVDKLSSDYKGDPSSALLEVLDSEQNSNFRDHYIEIPLDLSNVLFIATANDMQNIPKPLLDRMEIIRLSGYTQNEKQHIAWRHLIQKQKKAHCLKNEQLTFSKKAIDTIISSYTREAGVRELERAIGKVCRKTARNILEEKSTSVSITDKNIEEFLGKKKYLSDKAGSGAEVGIVRGLAWTSVGGEILEIEVNTYKGKGELLLTGQMGEVMQESAQAGISYIRSVAEQYNIAEDFFKEYDIHIHIPEGAVPKDGPSAGITMALAVLSAVTKRAVRASVAMTGEVTLRGRVLPIGGLKEKLLAAKTGGIKTVLVPKKNRADVEEISEEIKQGLEIKYVERMEQVIKESLV